MSQRPLPSGNCGNSRRFIPNRALQESFGLAQREMVEEPQGHGGLDGEIRVAPLPATPAGRPGSDPFRGHPHRHIAASNEGLIVGRPVRHPILRLIPGMNLRLHPRSVAPAEGPEKCGPRRPTRSGYSCNNAPPIGLDFLNPWRVTAPTSGIPGSLRGRGAARFTKPGGDLGVRRAARPGHEQAAAGVAHWVLPLALFPPRTGGARHRRAPCRCRASAQPSSCCRGLS